MAVSLSSLDSKKSGGRGIKLSLTTFVKDNFDYISKRKQPLE